MTAVILAVDQEDCPSESAKPEISSMSPSREHQPHGSDTLKPSGCSILMIGEFKMLETASGKFLHLETQSYRHLLGEAPGFIISTRM
jgi:hypothetical protein